MTISSDTLRLSVGTGAKRVDRNAKGTRNGVAYHGIIRGVAVMTKGEAKGHGMMIDETTLAQTLELGNAAKKGQKSRFGHPNLSNSGLGNHLGRAFDFVPDGDLLRADYYISPTAYSTPKGDLATYVLDMAENDPDAFGTSVVIQHTLEEQLNADGTQKKDASGKPLLPLVRVKKLRATDVVDEPAANDGFFSAGDGAIDDPARIATTYLDQFFAGKTREEIADHVSQFTNRYLTTKFGVPPVPEVTKPEVTKPAEVVTPPAAAQFTKADMDATVKAAVAEALAASQASMGAENKRVAGIVSLCKAAGLPEKADAYVADVSFSIEKVQGELLTAMCAKHPPVGPDGAPKPCADKSDPNAKYKAEYAERAAEYSKLGTTEEAYIKSRRIDDELAPLVPAASGS